MEITLGLQAALSVIASLLFSVCYMFGGRPNGRILKRIVAPLILASGAVIFSILSHRMNWATACCLIWFVPWGYGADSLAQKIVRRTVQSLFFTVPSLIFGIFGGNLEVAIYQVIFGALITVLFGIRNPVKASQEELLIAFSNTFLMGMVIL